MEYATTMFYVVLHSDFEATAASFVVFCDCFMYKK